MTSSTLMDLKEAGVTQHERLQIYLKIPSERITVLQTVRHEAEISTQCYAAPGCELDYLYDLHQKRCIGCKQKGSRANRDREQEERQKGSDANGNCVCPSKIGAEA